MTPINLETELVGSSYNPSTRVCTYTIERDGSRWTVGVPLQNLNAYKTANHKALRRQHVARVLHTAMQGAPNGNTPPETPIEPANVRPW
jgi:hypothetical protein